VDVRRAIPPAEELGESPLWPAAAIVAAAVLYADLPSRFIAGSSAGAFGVARWVVPSLTLLVLASLAAIRPRGRLTRRRLAIGTIGIVSVANAISIGLLIHLLINGAEATASTLLRAAVHMWVVNVLLFALWFWQLDGGGPLSRPNCAPNERDFLFPQQAEPALAESGWRPLFLDYLYVSFTNATAFSPTDAMPLSRWAKALMLLESSVSAVTLLLVTARAVNIFR
jgi:hypothetical protein